MSSLVDLAGRTVNGIQVLRISGRRAKHIRWLCRCVCGEEYTSRADVLQGSKFPSCGCRRGVGLSRHGYTAGNTKSREYRAWQNMKTRCYNEKFRDFKDYGGRGIKVCDEWQEFSGFIKDMGTCGSDLTLERVDANGDYRKENCKWASKKEQANNKRSNINIGINGETKTLACWVETLGVVSYGTARSRIQNLGWDGGRAVTTPPDTKKRNSRAKP